MPRPTLAMLVERTPDLSECGAEVVAALRDGLAALEARIGAHPSGDQTPLHTRLRRTAEADDDTQQ